MPKQRATPTPGLTRRQRSRIARETRLQRIILISVVVVALSVVGLIVFGLLNELYLIPRAAVARVDGDEITVAEFRENVIWTYFDAAQRAELFPFETPLTPEEAGQRALDGLIRERLLLHEAERLEIEVADEEVERRIQSYFGYNPEGLEEEGVSTATPSGPTLTPTATSTYVYTPTPSVTPTLMPGVTPAPTSTATPTLAPNITLTPTLTATPRPTATPMSEEDYRSRYQVSLDLTVEQTGLSPDSAERILRNQAFMDLLQEGVTEVIAPEIPETEIQVHAAHILVEDEETASELLNRINQGESFEELAAQYSIDEFNAYRGGDLGWFGPGDMVQIFEVLAFNIPIGEVDGPVHTEFGWHIIKVYDRAEMPVPESEREQARVEAFQNYMTALQTAADIWIDSNWMRFLPELPELALPTFP